MKLFKDGAYVGTFTNDIVLAAYCKENNIDLNTPEFEVQLTPREIKDRIRSNIAQQAGDTPSLLGTTSDAAAIATLGIAALTVTLASSSNYSKFKTAFLGKLEKLAGEQDMVAISTAFLQRIEDGDVIIPAMAKGIDKVLVDIETRSTAVSMALIAASKQD